MTTVECPVCGHDSERIYRCEACGRDLADVDEESESQPVPDGGQLGPQIRVTCPECDLETAVQSETVAEDLVDLHAEDRGCQAAEWEVIDDAE